METQKLTDSAQGWLGAVVFCVFLALYAVTAQHGVSWQDSGEFQYRVLAGDFVWCSGIARAHPLYIGMARVVRELFPASAGLYAVTLFSGVGMALALTLLAAVVWRLTGNRLGVVVAVVTLGLSHMAWWMSAVAEVYTWSLAGLMGELYGLVRFAERRQPGWLLVLFFANGAHAAIHNFAFLSLPVYLVLLFAEVRREGVAASPSFMRQAGRGLLAVVCVAGAWLAGAWLLVWLAVADWRTGGDVLATLKSLLFGTGYEAIVLGREAPVWRQVAANSALAGLSLLSPCWLFAWLGLKGLAEHGTLKKCLFALTLIHVLFWARYFVPDQAAFVLPTLGLLAVWVGIGAKEALIGEISKREKRGRQANESRLASSVLHRKEIWVVWLLATGVVSAVAGPWLLNEAVRRAGWGVARSRTLPFRDEARYWLLPWKSGERSAARFVEEVNQQVRAGDVLVSDATAAAPLLAAREAGVSRTDWRLITPWSGETDAELRQLAGDAKKRVFVVSPVAGYAPGAVLDGAAEFVREGVLFRVVGKHDARQRRE